VLTPPLTSVSGVLLSAGALTVMTDFRVTTVARRVMLMPGQTDVTLLQLE
jgi:hypothetical protein